eukprot:14530880-Alexandrium_andersonii.AAC.1
MCIRDRRNAKTEEGGAQPHGEPQQHTTQKREPGGRPPRPAHPEDAPASTECRRPQSALTRAT